MSNVCEFTFLVECDENAIVKCFKRDVYWFIKQWMTETSGDFKEFIDFFRANGYKAELYEFYDYNSFTRSCMCSYGEKNKPVMITLYNIGKTKVVYIQNDCEIRKFEIKDFKLGFNLNNVHEVK